MKQEAKRVPVRDGMGAGKSRRRQAQGAFTLVELLVVIAIIALLAALLMPALDSAKDQAKTAKCVNNIRQWGTAVAIFASEEQRYPVPSWNVGNSGWEDEVQPYIMPGSMSPATTLRASSLPQKYMGVLCPEAQRMYEQTLKGTQIDYRYLVNVYGQTHQHDSSGPIYLGCYVYNYYATYWGYVVSGYLQAPNTLAEAIPYSMKPGRHKFPSETAMLIEGTYGGASGFRFTGYQNAAAVAGSMAHQEFRHRKGHLLNVFFFDGHVSSFTDQTLPPDVNTSANSKFWRGVSDGNRFMDYNSID